MNTLFCADCLSRLKSNERDDDHAMCNGCKQVCDACAYIKTKGQDRPKGAARTSAANNQGTLRRILNLLSRGGLK